VSIVLRRGGTQDVRFLRDMLVHAYYWRARVPGSLVSRYVRGWGRPGDTAVIALEGGFPVGAAWFRVFPAAEPGYGFVDEATPELAIAVARGHRGRGIGRALLEAIHERARADGLTRLSLSVDDDNPAKRLYARVGYAEYEPGDGLGRMILTL
jgi:GNAT superfamily N-acetyltransferase